MTGAGQDAIRVLWVGIEPTDYLRDEIDDLERDGSVSVRRVFLAERLTQQWELGESDHVISTKEGVLPCARDLARFLFRIPDLRLDVALLEGYSPWQMIILAGWLRMRGVPYILRSDTPASERSRPIHRQMALRWIVSAASWCLPGGTPQRGNLLEAGANPRNMSIGFMGVDTNRFAGHCRQAPPDGLRLIGVGRLIERKGWLAAARVLRKLRDSGHRVELEIVGDGPLRNELALVASESTGLTLLGALSQREVAERLLQADAFILPARDEPWGLVVNEALASGLPVVIGKKVGCASDLVKDGVNGFLVDPDDDRSILMALRAFISNPSMIMAMSQEALRTSASWSTTRRREATIEALRRATGTR